MYDSLKEWCTFPVNIHKHSSFSISGDEILSKSTIVNGYRVDEMRKIVDKEGKEYISNVHVYFPPEVSITLEDMISFPEATTPREIRKIGGFSDGNTGTLSIAVVYL